jgi:hypothetical protein
VIWVANDKPGTRGVLRGHKVEIKT